MSFLQTYDQVEWTDERFERRAGVVVGFTPDRRWVDVAVNGGETEQLPADLLFPVGVEPLDNWEIDR